MGGPTRDWRRWMLLLVAVLTVSYAMRSTLRAVRARALDLAQPAERDPLPGAERVPDAPVASTAERARIP